MKTFKIADREIGGDQPAYIIAEISCNHEGDFDEAQKIIKAAAEAGADAVKIQTYKADTITRNFGTRPKGTIWEDLDLYKLYDKAHTPWEWTKDLKDTADEHGLHFFSSPFDETAVDFLVDIGVPVLKIASFEVVDIKLLEHMAATGLPIIMSNGMTDYLEMDEAVRTLRAHGCSDLALLHCNSGYPAAFDEANLLTIPAIEDMFDAVTGLSDHTLFVENDTYSTPMAHITPVEAVRLGAKIVELHLTLDRDHARSLFEKNKGGFDWPFSRNPDELKKMTDMIRHFEKTGEVTYESELERDVAARTHGSVCFQPTEKEMKSREVRPTLWVVEDMKQGDVFKCAAKTREGNFDSIRPGGGLHIRFTDFVEGRKASRDMQAGEPLSWDMLQSAGKE